MKDDKLYLLHIVESLDKVKQYTREGESAFDRDSKTQDAVLGVLQVMAESSTRLSDALKTAHPEVSWRRIAGFRNVVVHDYLGIHIDEIWTIVEREVPDLERKIRTIFGAVTEPEKSDSE